MAKKNQTIVWRKDERDELQTSYVTTVGAKRYRLAYFRSNLALAGRSTWRISERRGDTWYPMKVPGVSQIAETALESAYRWAGSVIERDQQAEAMRAADKERKLNKRLEAEAND